MSDPLWLRTHKYLLVRHVRKETARMVKRAEKEGGITALTIEVWGQANADAYMLVGWHPVSERLTTPYSKHTIRYTL